MVQIKTCPNNRPKDKFCQLNAKLPKNCFKNFAVQCQKIPSLTAILHSSKTCRIFTYTLHNCVKQ